MRLNLSADDVLTTTRAVRKRMDFGRPVEREVIEECLQLAVQAPTGSNRQGWQFVVVTDPALRQSLADIYRANFAVYRAAGGGVVWPQGDPRAAHADAVIDSAQYLADNLQHAPVHLVPCIEGRLDGAGTLQAASAWGSILPAVWSFMLAARERALGTAWTTLHLMGEGEARAAALLGIPDTHTQGGLIPVAYTIGTDFSPAARVPLDAVVHWDRW